jgi:hypothetical protein
MGGTYNYTVNITCSSKEDNKFGLTSGLRFCFRN